ncbi:hypothetical protein [Rhizobium leguminosarum]|uniref:hypothetical protein n=1 Tax=Rhizobium leguminosarum TaxID=384 RepID=UPI0018D517C2|nr:hypothetical protein [Rhizobium leguminosarum]
MTDADVSTSDFEQALARLPTGFFKGAFAGGSWGVTVRRSDDGRRSWLFAEDLAGNEIVSFNFYLTSEMQPVLKPCEMSSSKVVEFVIGIQPEGSSV